MSNSDIVIQRITTGDLSNKRLNELSLDELAVLISFDDPFSSVSKEVHDVMADQMFELLKLDENHQGNDKQVTLSGLFQRYADHLASKGFDHGRKVSKVVVSVISFKAQGQKSRLEAEHKRDALIFDCIVAKQGITGYRRAA